ncbi:MAG: DISARM system helicase DrmA, partial [Anaerolineae bacterium]|nr:DISARM system helicase DrmA [Anaerolineae bacterium]
MNVRDEMLIALVKEVLGPRDGPLEVLPDDHDPRQEYITGVLEPLNARTQEERGEDMVDQVEAVEETSSDEDQYSEGYAAATGIFSPALDPRALPRSIGLTFTVEATDDDPRLEICATWARYERTIEGFHRHPYSCPQFLVNAAQDDHRSVFPEPDVRLLVRSRPWNGGYRVSIFLTNERKASDEKRPQTVDYLFQPQIRVHLTEGTQLVPVQASPGATSSLEEEVREEESLSLQYHHRTALARGHMCAAIWNEIDPERLFDTEHPTEAPFAWTDAGAIPEAVRAKFSPASVRTELIPMYLVQAPEMNWDHQYGPSPELDPETLAETWQVAQIRQAIQPLIDGYRAWIAEQKGKILALEAHFQEAAERNLIQCQRTADRMAEAIEILCQDEDARLAFCFANKAIAMQARWKNNDHPLRWRPFQLAFILLNIPPLANPHHPDRQTCDLLWFPTGGGKTEAYLGLMAFLLGLRRLRARTNAEGDKTGAGVAVISRYTLRLLTIQQFRRALGVITACELLRVQGLKETPLMVGWRPRDYPQRETFLWGGVRFSAGLWVGGGVTPNQLRGFGPIRNPDGRLIYFSGALDILLGLKRHYEGPDSAISKKAAYDFQLSGEPAQVTQCPVCGSLLAVSEEGLGEGEHTLQLVYRGLPPAAPVQSALPKPAAGIQIQELSFKHRQDGYGTLMLKVKIDAQKHWDADAIDRYFWEQLPPHLHNAQLQSARPARPGYFVLSYPTQQNTRVDADFEIYCPNPDCELNQHVWAEQVPEPREKTGGHKKQVRQAVLGLSNQREPGLTVIFGSGMDWQSAPEQFRESGHTKRATSVPIPAFTVDDQVYTRCPSLVIATVDKFARLAFEGESAALFGNVTHYHSRYGYYRQGCPPEHPQTLSKKYDADGYFHHPSLPNLTRDVPSFAPPDLILQDELHLIEGPLGSMVGIYETAVDYLCQHESGQEIIRPKYIASTATVRRAEPQVKALFDRTLAQFPPPALSADDRFFATTQETHPLESNRSGRLYIGICAPGKGAQTPIVRIWSALLQRAGDLQDQTPDEKLDPFWTLVGYFNALRELAGALSLYRQDIPEWLKHRTDSRRLLDEYRRIELSSRSKSTDLPNLLRRLETRRPSPGAADAAFATSMFGTGVDVDRLSLMVVHGQPKT